MFGSLVMVRGWVVGPVFGSSVTAWVQCLGPVVGRGFIFYFLGCDWCLKGLWVVVGSGVWVVGLLRWV